MNDEGRTPAPPFAVRPSSFVNINNLALWKRGSMATTTLTTSKRRAQDRRVALKQAKRNAWAYVFISPFYLLYAVFGLFPLLYGLWLSLHKWDGISKMQWIGA